MCSPYTHLLLCQSAKSLMELIMPRAFSTILLLVLNFLVMNLIVFVMGSQLSIIGDFDIRKIRLFVGSRFDMWSENRSI